MARLSAAARSDWHVYPEAAAAGLWTTPADLARFALALQSVAAGRPSPLHGAAARLMLVPNAKLPGRGEWMLFPLFGFRRPDTYGLGLFLTGDEWFCHVGGAQAFVSMLTGSTLGGVGAMVAANAMPLLFRLMRTISAEEGWSGFRQRGLGRLTGLPGSLRSLL
jgi:CubicO group peptidase (beta-lactamase class C family)